MLCISQGSPSASLHWAARLTWARGLHAGLDARAAAIVMQSIKNVSRNGRTVMVTIHQPSIDIFESFDALVLLQRGGKVRVLHDWCLLDWPSLAAAQSSLPWQGHCPVS